MFEVVCKTYYKRGNPKPHHKSPIEAGDMEKLKSHFSIESQGKLQEFLWFLCYYLDQRGRKVGANSQGTSRRQSVSPRTGPLGKNSTAHFMPKISKTAGLSQVYTARCVRASTITSFHQAGVDAKQTCAITKHKSEESFTSYIKDSPAYRNMLVRTFLVVRFVQEKLLM